MARKQKYLNRHEKKWLKQPPKVWEILTSVDILHKNNDKPIFRFILDPVLDQFLGIH